MPLFLSIKEDRTISDPYNTSEGKDPQTQAILGVYEEQQEGSKSTKEEEEEKKINASLSMVKKGYQILKVNSYLVDNLDGKLRFKTMKPPKPIPGLTFPSRFQPYQPVYTIDDLYEIRDIFRAYADKDTYKFWSPVWSAHRGTEPLFQMAEYLDSLKVVDETEVLEYGLTIDPMGRESGIRCNAPVAYVPDHEWFPDGLREEVKFEDIFTIFPEAELEILKLMIGRIAVGRSGHKPPNSDKIIEHTCRMLGVIVGKDAGLGKSTLFDKFLKRAFLLLGYKVSTFSELGERFGGLEIAMTDFCLKDDCVDDSLKKLLKSEDAKILTTNGSYPVEVKFGPKLQVRPKCVIMVNTNNWDPMLSYVLDSGTIDRVKLLGTYLLSELNMKLEEVGGASKGTPSLQPMYHIPFLAEKYGVSPECLMAWAIRLAADRFHEVINIHEDEKGKPINMLEWEVKYWSSRLRYQFQVHIEQAILTAMFVCRAIRYSDRGSFFVPELTPTLFIDYLEDLYFVCIDPAGNSLFPIFKEDWDKSGRSSKHFYTGIRQLRYESISLVLQQYTNSPGKIKDMFGMIQLRSGVSLGSGQAYIVDNWQNTRIQQDIIFKQAKYFIDKIPEEDKNRILNKTAIVDDYWLKLPEYSPDRAEELRQYESTIKERDRKNSV